MLTNRRLSTFMLTAMTMANFAEAILSPIQLQRIAPGRNNSSREYLLLKYRNVKIIDENGKELPNPYKSNVRSGNSLPGQGVMSATPNFQRMEKSAVMKRIGLGNSQGERCSQDDLPYADEQNPKYYYACTKQGKRGYYYIKCRCFRGQFDSDEGACVWTGKVPNKPQASRSLGEKNKSHQR